MFTDREKAILHGMIAYKQHDIDVSINEYKKNSDSVNSKVESLEKSKKELEVLLDKIFNK
jgi:hypothetical protein